MSARLFFLGLLMVVFGLLVRELLRPRPAALTQTMDGRVEMCLACHQDQKPDQAHDARTIGCSPCHLGDPLAAEKKKAHAGVVKNPGDLNVVARTCGVEGCHGPDVHKVKNSLMATNRGIISSLMSYWGEMERKDNDLTVESLIKTGRTSLSLDYYRKLCATCHLWKKRGDLPGVFGEKGGGCTACHRVMPDESRADRLRSAGIGVDDSADGKTKRRPHPLITKKVPEENCIRCHNRSGRIGISFIGVYEAEGYGTPFEKGKFSSQRMPDDRFYLKLAEDAHHAKGMGCIDCHSKNEIMGDGKSYQHYEEQLEVRCDSCHKERPGVTAKNNLLPHVFFRKQDNGGNEFFLKNKLTDKEHPLRPPLQETCAFRHHRRLSCNACHSTWVPQCYGCHAKRDASDTHLDKLLMKETPGRWEEGRSYIRYERPMLAVWKDKVVVVTPGCQDIVTLVDKKGKLAGGFNRFTMAAISPHTTQRQGRSCADCHASTKTVGLGEGTVWKKNGAWFFRPLHQGLHTPFGDTPPFDAFVDINGRPLQHAARPDLRPFDARELRRILRVGQCLPCHKDYRDQAMVNYSESKPCPKFKEE